MALEQPSYTVVLKQGDIEYRQYEAYLVAETRIVSMDDYNNAANTGFRRLFNYISGDNTSRTKIAMTAPVKQAIAGEKIEMTAPVQQSQSASGWKISFMLPSEYDLATAPIPNDPRIRVTEVPRQLMAVKRFAGRWTGKNFEKHSNRLIADLPPTTLTKAFTVSSAVYDPPFMPPFLRRNEVMVPVTSLPATQ